jgi:hypothetical protein
MKPLAVSLQRFIGQLATGCRFERHFEMAQTSLRFIASLMCFMPTGI